MERGSSIVEFAISAAVVLLLMLGIVELGRLIAVHQAANHAVQEAARWGAAVGDGGAGVPRYGDCAGIRDAAISAGGLIALTGADVAISYLDGTGTEYANCPEGGSGPATVDNFDRIVVTATTTFDSVLPLVDSASITATNRRTIVGGS